MSSAPWRPSGVVTLITDFGVSDAYVGIMHGVLLSRARDLAVVDLTHGIAPQDVRAAAFHLAQSWRWFPPGTVHVAVVDPGVGSSRRILVAREGEHAFLAPDNGLLGPVLSPKALAGTEVDVRALDVARFELPGASRTFHGRDVFAPAAAALARGLDPAQAGAPAGAVERLEFPVPARRSDGSVEGEVLAVDRFGNLITNVPAALLDGPAERWRARLAGRSAPARGTYAEVERGALVALVDSFGFWELAVRDGSAAAELGLEPGAPVRFERIRR